ncbi:MAG: hypothetical protein K6A39_03580 [Clostridiales bacterium]|nr:hypothetical protein [Clostridiales bacterium]
MTKHITAKVLAACAAVLTGLQAAVCVHAEDTVEVINHIGTGAVVIGIEEYQLNEKGKEVPFQNHQTVLPGQTVSKIVRFRNRGEDVWLRAEVNFTSEDGIEEDILCMTDVSDENWILAKDGYWYLTVPLKKGKTVDFFDHIYIPSDWNSEYAGKDFHVTVHADAVQEIHFTPDFSADSPWFGTVIEQSLYDHTRTLTQTDMKFSVSYQGGAEGLIRKGDDFFSNWGTMMPGDTWTDSLSVYNGFRYPVTLYFHTENVMDSELADAAKLKIWTGEKLVYEGSLSGTLNEISLAYMKPGTGFAMRYELSLPETLKNRYAMQDAATKWVFRAAVHGPSSAADVSTGDAFDPARTAAAAAVSLVLALTAGILLIRRKRKAEGGRE